MVIIHRALMTLAVSPILCFSREAARSCRRLRASVFLLPARKSQVSVQSRAAPGVAEALGSMAWAAPWHGPSGEQMCCLPTSAQGSRVGQREPVLGTRSCSHASWVWQYSGHTYAQK